MIGNVASGSITLHGALTDTSGEFVPINLNAAASFPACRYTKAERPLPPTAKSWASRPVVSDASQIVLSLGKFIGEGRIGMVYSARVESASDASGADVSNALPSELCIKVAKPTFARSLAREAWFYEQLGDCQGTSTAKCFGFFTAPLSECKGVEKDAGARFEPWLASQVRPKKINLVGSMTSEDWLEDDVRNYEYTDEQRFKTDSSWNKWRPSENPLFAILVLEKLGAQIYGIYAEPAATRESLRAELRQIVHDIATTGITHRNLTAHNILRAPSNSTEICPRHRYVHNWRLVDFDRSFKIVLANCDDKDMFRFTDLPDDVACLIVTTCVEEITRHTPGKPKGALALILTCKQFMIWASPLIYRFVFLFRGSERVADLLRRTLQGAPFLAAFVRGLAIAGNAPDGLKEIVSMCHNLRDLVFWSITEMPAIDLSRHTELRRLSYVLRHLGVNPANPTPPPFLMRITHLDLIDSNIVRWSPLLSSLPNLTHICLNVRGLLSPDSVEVTSLLRFLLPSVRVCILFLLLFNVERDIKAFKPFALGEVDPRIIVGVDFQGESRLLKLAYMKEWYLLDFTSFQANFWFMDFTDSETACDFWVEAERLIKLRSAQGGRISIEETEE